MRISCAKNELLNGVNIVLKAVPSKTTMTILECILITAQEGTIMLTANDTEIGIDTVVTGMIEEEGMIALDAKLFSDIVRKLPDNIVYIETDANHMAHIICEKSKFNLVGKAGDDFPYPENVQKEDHITVSQYTLKEIIRQTIFSISDNDNNKIMAGELFEINGSTLKVVSLDGHRISIRNIELRQDYPYRKVIIPGKTLSEISKILSGEVEKVVDIFFTDSNAVFEFNHTVVVTRLIEGEYFNVDQMLSSDYETKVVINRRELIDCIDRGTLLVKDNDKKPIIINIEDQNMEFKINSTIGSMNEELEIEKSGNDLMIGFNPKFLLEALRVIDDESVSLYFMNAKAPCFIRDDENKYIYLILPVNFNTVS